MAEWHPLQGQLAKLPTGVGPSSQIAFMFRTRLPHGCVCVGGNGGIEGFIGAISTRRLPGKSL